MPPSFSLLLSFGLTELPGGLDVDVVVAAADADDDAQCLELLQVLSSQGDGMVHHGPDCLVQHLCEREDVSLSLYDHISSTSTIISCVITALDKYHRHIQKVLYEQRSAAFLDQNFCPLFFRLSLYLLYNRSATIYYKCLSVHLASMQMRVKSVQFYNVDSQRLRERVSAVRHSC